ncbi:hypothetical protein [Archangium violaceum]|nr:hypothetical protein [Archangium violaceum]
MTPSAGASAADGEHGSQVINFGRDEDDKAVPAHSLAEVLEWLVT